jgi:Histidine phosphatase superfamily (branch 1)
MVTVLLVSHTDIDLPPGSSDPPLNADGQARARALVHVAGSAGISAIFTSEFVRTKQTIKTLADRSASRELHPTHQSWAGEAITSTAFGLVDGLGAGFGRSEATQQPRMPGWSWLVLHGGGAAPMLLGPWRGRPSS